MTYVLICVVFGVLTALVGRAKGSSFFLWLLIGAIAPIVGLLAALLYRVERDVPRRECPGCGKVVPIYQAICTRCGTELDYPEAVIPPESAVAGR